MIEGASVLAARRRRRAGVVGGALAMLGGAAFAFSPSACSGGAPLASAGDAAPGEVGTEKPPPQLLGPDASDEDAGAKPSLSAIYNDNNIWTPLHSFTLDGGAVDLVPIAPPRDPIGTRMSADKIV